jgi:F-type H+-transporting ATPase subunit delta
MTNRAAAARYARALFDVSLAEADPAVVSRALEGFVSLVRDHADLEGVLATPAVPPARKVALVEALAAKLDLPPVVGRLLRLLATRDRLVLLADLSEFFRARLLDHQRVVRAEVTSAVPLPADRVEKLRAGLAGATGREVQIETQVDPSILGGVVTRVGSLVFDGSVTRQLERMRERLAEGQATPVPEP